MKIYMVVRSFFAYHYRVEEHRIQFDRHPFDTNKLEQRFHKYIVYCLDQSEVLHRGDILSQEDNYSY